MGASFDVMLTAHAVLNPLLASPCGAWDRVDVPRLPSW